MHRLIVALCVVVGSDCGVRAEEPSHIPETQIALGTRFFELGEPLNALFHEAGDETVALTQVDWIGNLARSDPLLTKTVILIKDNTRMLSGSEPPWRPDNQERFHPDPTLPPVFEVDGYEVGWLGVHEAPVRGDVLMFPREDPKRFDVVCAYDRADTGPSFCSVTFLYGPDRNLLVDTRIFQVTAPLNDFAEIASRVDALIRCLDVTEAVRAREPHPAFPYLLSEDIAVGGKCRKVPSS